MNKITFQELKDCREKWKTAVIVFTEKSFDKPYSEQSRSYRLSENDMWGLDDSAVGRRVTGSCLDGTDQDIRLDHYMCQDNPKDNWKVEYCYVEEWL